MSRAEQLCLLDQMAIIRRMAANRPARRLERTQRFIIDAFHRHRAMLRRLRNPMG